MGVTAGSRILQKHLELLFEIPPKHKHTQGRRLWVLEAKMQLYTYPITLFSQTNMHSHMELNKNISLSSFYRARCAAEPKDWPMLVLRAQQEDQALVTGRGATVYRWESSRHTWSHTHWRRKCV